MLTLSLTKRYEGWWAAMLARKAALTLQDCLQGYTQEETLPVHPSALHLCMPHIFIDPKRPCVPARSLRHRQAAAGRLGGEGSDLCACAALYALWQGMC